MRVLASIKHEARAILLTTSYFAAWFVAMVMLKGLILSEYSIEFAGVSKALIGALIVAKAVLILDRVPLTGGPAWIDVLVATALFSLGVVAVLVLEHGIEGRNGPGGFFGAVRRSFTEAGPHHIGATTICVVGALLVYNAFAVLRSNVGLGALQEMFTSPIPRRERRPSRAD